MCSFKAKLLTNDETLWQQENDSSHELIVKLLTEMKFHLKNIQGVITAPDGKEVFRCSKIVKDPFNAKILLFKDA